MMPKLPPIAAVLSDAHAKYVADYATDYARAVAVECARIADTHAVVKAEGPARTACEMVATAIRKAAEELGK